MQLKNRNILLLLPIFIVGVVFGAMADTRPPSIGNVYPFANALMPVGDFDFEIEYDDAGSGINAITDGFELEKWTAGSGWGGDIAPTYVAFGSKVVTALGASFPVSNLPYGKYRATILIDDNSGNTREYKWIFYRDQVDFTLSGPDVDLGNISIDTLMFSPTPLQVQVQTIGAGFDVVMKRGGDLEEPDGDTIDEWDGSRGYGKNQSGSVSAIGTGVTIASQIGAINADGVLQTFTYDIDFGVLVESDQIGGDYEGPLTFEIYFDFDGQAFCILDNITEFGCRM